MQSEKGVYALIMQLKKKRTITVGKLGTFDFEKGWYVYLGTAHGSGGLAARTGRHRRDDSGKKKKWNVDYLREFAAIHEIWFSHAPQHREHDWATTVMGMSGASVPVIEFGAQDCSTCDAHLVYFAHRPFVAEFRASVQRQWPSHKPIFAEFADELRGSIAGKESSQSVYSQYLRGHRFRETLRRFHYDRAGLNLEVVVCNSFAKYTKERRVIDEMSSEMNVPANDLIADAKLAMAVDALSNNLNDDVFAALFHGLHPQTRDAILKLSRTSDTRQQYRIRGVLEGRFRSVAPQNGDCVFDTVAFSEVVSRLARSRGAIQKLAAMAQQPSSCKSASEWRPVVEQCHYAAKTLQRFVFSGSAEEHDVPDELSKTLVMDQLKNGVAGKVGGLAKLALRLTIKSVWDFPEMCRRDLMPTETELEKCLAEIASIVSTSEKLMSTI